LQKERLFWTDPNIVSLKLMTSSGLSKTIDYYTEDYTWYLDRHDFTVNLFYSEDTVSSLTLTFSSPGVYSFDSIEIFCQPMDSYADQISLLKSSGLENLDLGTNTVSGTITLDKPEILCFSIPYSDGWTAYVDGEEATLYKANMKNMAVVLDEGTHSVVLSYHTPYLKQGAIISACGCAIFAVACGYGLRKQRKGKAENLPV
jgi:uncharacterized membrane protein YfhO